MVDLNKLEKDAFNMQQAGYYEEAIRHWEELLSYHNDWDYGYPCLNISNCYVELGNFDKALEAIKKALEFDHDNEYFVGNYKALLEDRKRGLI